MNACIDTFNKQAHSASNGQLSTSKPFNVSTFSLGKSKENARVWLQTRYLEKIGLAKSTLINIIFNKTKREIIIAKDDKGTHRVSGRSNGLPIVDIKNKMVADTLGNVDKITVRFYSNSIVIRVSQFEQKKAERRAKRSNKAVEIFSGAGTYSKFSEMAGFKLDTVVERDDRYIDIFEKNIANTTTICADVRDVELEDLPKNATLLSMGYPCTSYSTSNVVLARKLKDESLSQEAVQERKDADFLSLALLDIIRHINPFLLVIEEVVAFKDSLPFEILKYALERMEYKISVQEVNASFTERKRLAIVAIADDEPVDLSNIQYQAPVPIETHLDIPVSERDFTPIEERPRESGALRKGLGIRCHLPSDTKINTVTMHWTRHTTASLLHPTKPHHYSDFTTNEIRRIHGLPEDFQLGDKVTIARAALGQGVADGFLSVLRIIYDRVCRPVTKTTTKTRKARETGQLALEW